ncbi:hypothetical protein FRC07_003879 [Ceratobasidium sp. 392]|nr:hypothetical protein FRC07_003879 [Ceratobasidium sp. 392]
MARTKNAKQETPEPTGTDKFTTQIPAIFQQTQVTLANHRKNVVALAKLFSGCAGIYEEVKGRGGGIRLTGEKAFQTTFAKMVNNVLPVKKGVSNADKVVKFIGAFVKYITDKAASQKAENGEEEDSDDDDTPASRFVTYLLKYLLQGFMAKDKNVRYRCVHITAEMVSGLGEIDDDIYEMLRSGLLNRAQDKETFVRLQAAIALAKLQRGENEQEEEREVYLSDVLIDMLQHDSAPEVRRAALLNLAPSQKSLTVILSRTRDVDTTLRKIVYHHVLSGLKPQLLTVAQREEIVSNGLGDREPTVRGAAAQMIGTWVDAKDGDLIEFLKSFDLLKSKVAEDALLSVFVTRVDVFGNVEFKEDYWNNLTPERAFLARVYIEHCTGMKYNDRLDANLPVVTHVAFRIQAEYNRLLQLSIQLEERQAREEEDDKDDDKSEVQLEEAVVDTELVVGELLGLAVNLDYGDEIGRRKMFGLMRDILSQEALPEKLVNKALDVLAKLSENERDLIRVVVEIVTELRDISVEEPEPAAEGTQADDRTTQWGDEERTQAGPSKPNEPEQLSEEELEHKLAVDLRCVTLCVGMLERVNSTLQENSALHGLVPQLIIPSIRGKDPQLRERGLICLGLCCLIDKNMALASHQLFVNQVHTAGFELKKKVLPILYDLMMVHHDAEYLREARMINFLMHQLEDDEDEIQAITCVGFAKLLLAGVVMDEKVLRSLVAAYFQPDTADNQIFIVTFKLLSEVYREKDDDQEMVAPAQFGAHLIDWMDPTKIVEVPGLERDESVHVDAACDIIRELFEKEMSKEDRKILVQMLSKLHLPDELENLKVLSLHLLITNLRRCRPLRDAPTRNAFKKFDTVFRKKYAEQLTGMTQAEHESFGELHIQELQSWIDEVEPDSDAEEIEPPEGPAAETNGKRGSRARRAKTAGAEAGEKTKKNLREVDAVLKEEETSQDE